MIVPAFAGMAAQYFETSSQKGSLVQPFAVLKHCFGCMYMCKIVAGPDYM